MAKMSLTGHGFDALFGTEGSENMVQEIRLDLIDGFPDHPFQVNDDEDMAHLVDSIREQGVITPVILRQKPDGRYEMISGHRRRRACELLDMETIKAEVREMTDDEATIFMVDANLQRTSLKPSEKAKAYKLRMDAMRHQGRRTDLENARLIEDPNEPDEEEQEFDPDTTSTPMVAKYRSDEQLAKEVGESRENIRRYMRLNNLTPELLEDVDDGKIGLQAAVELSYVDVDGQDIVADAIRKDEKAPSVAQAKQLRGLSAEEGLTQAKYDAVMAPAPPKEPSKKFTLTEKEARKYIPTTVKDEEVKAYILDALKFYRENT